MTDSNGAHAAALAALPETPAPDDLSLAEPAPAEGEGKTYLKGAMKEKEAELMQVIAQARQARADLCLAEIEATLKRHNCRFQIEQAIIDGRPGPVIVRVVSL